MGTTDKELYYLGRCRHKHEDLAARLKVSGRGWISQRRWVNQAREEKCFGQMSNGYIVKGNWGKVNGVGKGSGLRTDPQGKERKWEDMGLREKGKEDDEWRRRGEQTADGSARKRAKMGGYGVKGKG